MEIHNEWSAVYGDSTPSYAQVKFYVEEFKKGRVNLEDVPRPDRPLDVTNDLTSKAVRQLVVKDRQMNVSEMEKAWDILDGSVHTILQYRLDMRKRSVRLVSKWLSYDQKIVPCIAMGDLAQLSPLQVALYSTWFYTQDILYFIVHIVMFNIEEEGKREKMKKKKRKDQSYKDPIKNIHSMVGAKIPLESLVTFDVCYRYFSETTIATITNDRGTSSSCRRNSASPPDRTTPARWSSSTPARGSVSTEGKGSTSTMGRGSTSRPPNDVDLVYIQSITNHQIDKWKMLFDSVDRTGACEMAVEDFQRVLQDPEFYPDLDRHTTEVLQMKCLEPNRQFISYQEFINIMSNKRNPSFRLAVETQGKEQFLLTENPGPTLFNNMVRKVAKHYLTDDVERQYYADKYTCCPPPLFVPIITVAEVGFFVYHCLEANSVSTTGPVPVHSVLIYRPDRRIELWRFILYMFIHAGWVHLFFNMLVQIVVGIPLEMVHGSLRIALVYLAGVLAGSLGTSVFDIQVYLVGASGGVYALLAAHLANVMLNYTNMEFGVIKLAAVLIVASADVGFAIWDRYSSSDAAPPVGYTAHLMGALAGLTVGLVVLKNFEQKLHEQYLWWISLSVYLVCFAFAIFWNVFYY